MPRTYVVVERDENSQIKTVLRQGVVTSGRPAAGKGEVTVAWDDATVETITLGKPFLSFPHLGLKHVRATRPDELSVLANGANPEELLVLALRDIDGALSEAMIRKALIGAGLDRSTVEDALKRGKRALASRPDVERGSKGYRWVGELDIVDEAHTETSISDETAPSTEATEAANMDATSDADQAAPEQAPAAANDAPLPQEPAGKSKAEPADSAASHNTSEPGEPRTTTDPMTAHLDGGLRLIDAAAASPLSPDEAVDLAGFVRKAKSPLLRLLSGAINGTESASSTSTLAKTPLSTACALSDRSRATLNTLVAVLPEVRRFALLGGIDEEFHFELLPPGAHVIAGKTLSLAAEELREAGADRPSLLSAFQRMITRAESAGALRRVPAPVLVDCLDNTAPGAWDPTSELLLDALASSLRTAKSWESLTEEKRSRLRVQASRPKLTESPARGRLLGSLAKVSPETIAHASWWSNLTLDELLTTGDGPVAPALDLRAVGEQVVYPIVRDGLRDAMTRRRAMTIFAGPISVVRHIPPSDVASTLRRIGADDPLLDGWTAETQDRPGRHALEARASEAAKQVDDLRALAAGAQLEAREALKIVESLEGQLTRLSGGQEDMRESQKRQLKIDAMRSFANLAAFVDDNLERSAPERLRARLGALAAREGLEQVGGAHETTSFDPLVHESLARGTAVGATVRVTRIGYAWGPDNDKVVLVKALVEPL